MRNKERFIEKKKELDERGVKQKISSMTIMELHEGAIVSERPEKERNRMTEVLESQNIVEIDRRIMKKAGKISGKLLNKGERIEREDCIIAATALQNEEPLITENTKHFKKIENLELEKL